MTVLKCEVIIPSVTGLAANNFMNTFHFITPTGPGTVEQAQNAIDKLEEFYTEPSDPSSRTLSDFFSPMVDAGQDVVVRVYDIDLPTPNYPILENSFALSGIGGSALPSEVAVCLSWRAALESGVNAARRRNRIYFGPLNTSATTAGSGDVRPGISLIEGLTENAVRLADTDIITDEISWCGYSPTDEEAWFPVLAWVDNAMDTQRRRGVAPSSRVSIAIPTP